VNNHHDVAAFFVSQRVQSSIFVNQRGFSTKRRHRAGFARGRCSWPWRGKTKARWTR